MKLRPAWKSKQPRKPGSYILTTRYPWEPSSDCGDCPMCKLIATLGPPEVQTMPDGTTYEYHFVPEGMEARVHAAMKEAAEQERS